MGKLIFLLLLVTIICKSTIGQKLTAEEKRIVDNVEKGMPQTLLFAFRLKNEDRPEQLQKEI